MQAERILDSVPNMLVHRERIGHGGYLLVELEQILQNLY